MLGFTHGNLFDSGAEAIVNTVNTVGVMGKGIALMFKEKFPENFKAYERACKREEIVVGRMFVTETDKLTGPRYIINFPTKKHWRNPSKLEWVREGLKDLRRVIEERGIASVAIPPLGSGNGGLDWPIVRGVIEEELGDILDVEVIVYEPTAKYQSVEKGKGVEKLTPARAIMAEIIRRYGVLGLDCSILEAQKLAWVLSRALNQLGIADPLKLTFGANRYGPYSQELMHLLNALDGSFLHCEKRVSDAAPLDSIYFDYEWRDRLAAYLTSAEGAPYVAAIETADELIDGFQSPLGMEVLATVDWLLSREGVKPTLIDVKSGLAKWPSGPEHGERKLRLFTDKLLQMAIGRLASFTPKNA